VRLRDADGSPFSTAQWWLWEETGVRKNFVSGIDSGKEFRMSACCYSGGSNTWGGNLRF
jgi:hypothetical protein